MLEFEAVICRISRRYRLHAEALQQTFHDVVQSRDLFYVKPCKESAVVCSGQAKTEIEDQIYANVAAGLVSRSKSREAPSVV